MLYNIEQVKSPNFEDRYGQVPILFVLHITDGQDAARDSDDMEERAVDNTFLSPASQCSSHGGIERDGRIKQYVDIRNTAWTQGLHSASEELIAPSVIVRQMAGVNPNYYSIGLEFLAYKDHGGNGNITDEQFWAGCWLIKYWQDQVQKIFGHKIPLNNTYVIGHCHVDPINRATDPGPVFPWKRLFNELAIADGMTLSDYEGRLGYLKSDKYKLKKCVDVWNEVGYLKDCADGVYGDGVKQWALGVFKTLYTAFDSLGVLKDVYTETNDYSKFYGHVVYIYNTAMGKEQPENVGWGIDMMTKVHPFMLQNGLVPAA